MKSPFTCKEMRLCKENRTFSFRKEEFSIVYHFYKCDDTGESFTTTELDNLNLNQLYNQYRAKHKLPFPDQIIKLRKKYGLSAVEMSEVLGFGPNSYRNYESGEVPNMSNSRLIQLVEDAREFKKLLILCKAFEGETLEKKITKLDSIIKEQEEQQFTSQLKQYLIGDPVPNTFTGFRLPDFEKFTGMVIFFINKLNPWKTKLNKLLFYADFMMYSGSGYSISGMRYRAIPMGPVPENYNSIFEYLAGKVEIDIHITTFSNGGIGEKFKTNPKYKMTRDIFSESELNVLEKIAEKFRSTSTDEIIGISHKGKGWIDNNRERKNIDYKYSFDIDF
jgi:putative zinc finger/helix-turn-helix YgiT family protein